VKRLRVGTEARCTDHLLRCLRWRDIVSERVALARKAATS